MPRIVLHITNNSDPRLIEEDIVIALRSQDLEGFEINEQDEDCFTVDWLYDQDRVDRGSLKETLESDCPELSVTLDFIPEYY